MDDLAAKMKMDPLELFLKNVSVTQRPEHQEVDHQADEHGERNGDEEGRQERHRGRRDHRVGGRGRATREHQRDAADVVALA